MDPLGVLDWVDLTSGLDCTNGIFQVTKRKETVDSGQKCRLINEKYSEQYTFSHKSVKVRLIKPSVRLTLNLTLTKTLFLTDTHTHTHTHTNTHALACLSLSCYLSCRHSHPYPNLNPNPILEGAPAFSSNLHGVPYANPLPLTQTRLTPTFDLGISGVGFTLGFELK